MCAQRLLSGAVDGSSGHESVGAALRNLLQAARAQLDRQVEVRMRQAGQRSGSKPSSGGSSHGGSRLSAATPAERRVRLEFRD